MYLHNIQLNHKQLQIRQKYEELFLYIEQNIFVDFYALLDFFTVFFGCSFLLEKS